MFKNFQNKLQSQIRFKSVFTIIMLTFFLLVANSCNKEIKPEKGGIDLISNVYVDASKGLNKVQNFHISRLNYLHNDIIEVVPDLNFPEITDQIFYIKDSLCFKINPEQSKSTILSEIFKTQKSILTVKKLGIRFYSRKITKGLRSILKRVFQDFTFILPIPFCHIQFTVTLKKTMVEDWNA